MLATSIERCLKAGALLLVTGVLAVATAAGGERPSSSSLRLPPGNPLSAALRGEPHGGGGGHPSGAQSATCLLCHEPLREQLGKAVAHEPAAKGNCVGCHAPHAARYEHLLNKRERALCYSCHEEQKLAFQTGHVHTPILQGQCTPCHAVHGSDNAKLLVAEGSALCFSCHKDLELRTQSGTVHDPVVQGECLLCHKPHNSPQEGQLIAPHKQLCAVCHDASDEALVESHMGIPIANADCTGCHDPHASKEKGMFLATAHEPFAGKQCDMCHMLDSDTPQVLIATGRRLCQICHDQYPRKEDTVVHGPVKDGTCDACHQPHASRQARLLAKPNRELCASCHADVQARFQNSRSSHPLKDETGACGACHQPHSSREAGLLHAGPIRTCLNCHETQRHGHPLGEDRLDPRTGQPITCLTCHDPHGTEFPMTLRGDQSRGLCLECHTPKDHGGGG